MKIDDTVRTRMGFVGKVEAMCGDGCVRVYFPSTGSRGTYPESHLTMHGSKKDRVYEAAMALHRLSTGQHLVSEIQDAERALHAACREIDFRSREN